MLGPEAGDQVGEEVGHAVDVDAVQVAVGGGVDLEHLVLDRQRVALGLVQGGHQPLAAGQGALGFGVEVGAELGEGLEVAVLREVELQPAGDPPHGLIWALPPTRETEIPTLMAGRTPE